MTPQEKAEELVNDFYDTTPNEAWINEPLGLSKEYKAWEQAKQCAIIAVDVIIKEWDNEHGRNSKQKYWKEVKQEIEKL
jgi:hypothetical protein